MEREEIKFDYPLTIDERETSIRVTVSLEYWHFGNRVLYREDIRIEKKTEDRPYLDAKWPTLIPLISNEADAKIREFFESRKLAYRKA